MTIVMWMATPLLVSIAVEDLRHRRIRNRDVLVLATFTGVVVATLATGHGGVMVTRAIVGAGLAALPLTVAALAQPGRMGGGDVKLAAVTGALLGTVSPWLSLIAVASALLLTLGVLALRRAPSAPLAPALAAVTVTALLLSTLL